MVSIDKEFCFCSARACRYRWCIKLIVDATLALTLFLEEVSAASLGECFHSGRRSLTQPEESERFVMTSTCKEEEEWLISIYNNSSCQPLHCIINYLSSLLWFFIHCIINYPNSLLMKLVFNNVIGKEYWTILFIKV